MAHMAWSEESFQEFILSCYVGLGIQLGLRADQKAPWPAEPSHQPECLFADTCVWFFVGLLGVN